MEALPADFYDYRKAIDFGNQSFTYLRPYYTFMLNHIQNLSYMDCSMDCTKEGMGIKNQLHFNEHKMHLIDSLIVEKELKDNLFGTLPLTTYCMFTIPRKISAISSTPSANFQKTIGISMKSTISSTA